MRGDGRMTQKIDKHEINLSRWEFIRNVTRQELIDLGYSRSTRGWLNQQQLN